MSKVLSITCCLVILSGMVFAQAPEFRYEPPKMTLYWAPPPEFVVTGKEWAPPAGYERYAQPWAPPADWGAPDKWDTEVEFE